MAGSFVFWLPIIRRLLRSSDKSLNILLEPGGRGSPRLSSFCICACTQSRACLQAADCAWPLAQACRAASCSASSCAQSAGGEAALRDALPPSRKAASIQCAFMLCCPQSGEVALSIAVDARGCEFTIALQSARQSAAAPLDRFRHGFQHRSGIVPADAGIGDALAVLKGGDGILARRELLRARLQVAFHHDGEDAS